MADDGEIDIVEFDPVLAADFARLNYEWIRRYYAVEPHDRDVLDNPFENVIQPGGAIFFAVADGNVVGTVALMESGGGGFELAKMSVDAAWQGKGIGRRLLTHSIDFARARGKSEIVLESNTELATAIHLYRSAGFEETPLDPDSHFCRVNIRMRLAL